MENKNIYQGVAIIDDHTEGHCITFYSLNEKRDYDLDVKDGKLASPDNRIILKSEWLDTPTDYKTIDIVASRLFQESYK